MHLRDTRIRFFWAHGSGIFWVVAVMHIAIKHIFHRFMICLFCALISRYFRREQGPWGSQLGDIFAVSKKQQKIQRNNNNKTAERSRIFCEAASYVFIGINGLLRRVVAESADPPGLCLIINPVTGRDAAAASFMGSQATRTELSQPSPSATRHRFGGFPSVLWRHDTPRPLGSDVPKLHLHSSYVR